MLTQKTVKTKSNTTIKNAEKIMDKKTKRKYQKMFKHTVRRKQRLFEKKEVNRMINEYNQDRWEDVYDDYAKNKAPIRK